MILLTCRCLNSYKNPLSPHDTLKLEKFNVTSCPRLRGPLKMQTTLSCSEMVYMNYISNFVNFVMLTRWCGCVYILDTWTSFDQPDIFGTLPHYLGLENYSKKWVNSRQNSQNGPKLCNILRFLCLKEHWLEKNIPLPVLAVLTNISYGFNLTKKLDFDRILNCPRAQTCGQDTTRQR